MRKLTVGLFAHVDAGKSTFAENIIKERNDVSFTFLDQFIEERKRGITIFLKTIKLLGEDYEITFLDTPGHRDFIKERKRALQAIDIALFILPANEMISNASKIIFNELKDNHIPIIVLMNKSDLSIKDENNWLRVTKEELSALIGNKEENIENIVLSNEKLLNQYLKEETIAEEEYLKGIKKRLVYPFFFASAIKPDSLKDLKELLISLAYEHENEANLDAYVYKIIHEKGLKLAFIKINKGTIKTKDILSNGDKVEEIRSYQGNSFKTINQAMAGDVVALRGTDHLKQGMHLPSNEIEKEDNNIRINYLVESDNQNETFKDLRLLEEELPELLTTFNPTTSTLTVNINGDLMADVLLSLMKDRFNKEITLTLPKVQYKETIRESVYGIAHFDVLKHFAEVTVYLEKTNDGFITFETKLDHSSALFLLKELNENPPMGLYEELTGLKIHIIDVKTSDKHTGSTDLLEALYRAINQALKKNNPLFLEPYAIFKLSLNLNNLYDFLQRNGGEVIDDAKGICTLPLINLKELLKRVDQEEREYELIEIKYQESQHQKEIIDSLSYDERKHISSSLFLKNNTVLTIDGNEIEEYLNIHFDKDNTTSSCYERREISEEELKRVWNNTYKEKPRYIEKEKKIIPEVTHVEIKDSSKKETCFLIDGYNLMYASEYKELAQSDISLGREKIIELLHDMQGYFNNRMIVVFDAYKRENKVPSITPSDNLTIIFTRKDETADRYIQENAASLAKKYRLFVVSSDALIQLSILGSDAYRLSSLEFLKRYERIKTKIALPEKKKIYPLEGLKTLFND